MKHLVSVVSLLLIFQQVSAQEIDSLHQKMVGTWKLINYLSTNNSTGNESPDKIKRIKVFNQSNYTLSLYDVKSEKMIGKVTGDYRLYADKSEDRNYEEKVVSAAPKLEPSGLKTRKSVSIDEGDRMIFIWTDNFIKYTEIWSRVAEKEDSEKLRTHKNTE
jgi:hypothetical protein